MYPFYNQTNLNWMENVQMNANIRFWKQNFYNNFTELVYRRV